MSAAASRLAPERGARPLPARRSMTPSVPVAVFPVAAGGLALLLARPWLVSKGMGALGLAALFLALAAMSVAPFPKPQPLQAQAAGLDRQARPLGLGVILATGLLVLTFVRFASGPVPPLPATADAVALNTLAAVAEEAFFRRFLYGRLVPLGAPLAVVMCALAFALVHVPLYGEAVFWVDLGAGLLLGWQRWASGSWAAPAATHAFANVLAVLR